jgi:carbamate kinase
MSTVVALGGNALMRPGERGTAAEQLANVRRAVSALKHLIDESQLVITHGNGPQVGNELLRQERAADEAPPLPLWLAVAQTQAEIGALIAAEVRPAVDSRPVACVLTHVRVTPDDSDAEAEELQRDRGWTLVSDANRGRRRVVPSPLPLEVVELGAIRTLAEGGTITIACGGGGIPVVKRGGRLTGVDAVIDKDRASALLAKDLGAERLVILTEVPAVYRHFGTDRQVAIANLTLDEAGKLLPELGEGSMRPKVEAAIAFGGETLITSFDGLASGEGTCIGA